MKILLLGSTGFIGNNLKEDFEGKYELLTPNRYELDLLNCDNLSKYLKKNQIDIIVNSSNTNNTKVKNKTNYEILDSNLRMFYNLCKCSDLYKKMYYFGSGAEYDTLHYTPNMSEEYFGEYIPKDPYGFSKYIMSEHCKMEDNIYDLRLFGVFGKYEEYDRRFISNAICRALAGKSITINKNVFFDYLFVDDLSKIMMWFLEKTPQYKHYNVCTGTRIDLYTLSLMIREILGVDCPIEVREEGLKSEYTGDNTRLMKEMGEFHFTRIEDAIYKLTQWYKSNWYLINPELI